MSLTTDELKAIALSVAAALEPTVKTLVDVAVAKIPVAGPLLVPVLDAGLATVTAKYFPSTGVQPVVQNPAASELAKATGTAAMVPTAPTIVPSDHEDEDLADIHNRISILEAKVEALSAATGLQTSAAMAGH